MSATLTHLTFDCTDALGQAAFWAAVLDQPVADGGTARYAVVGERPGWYFLQVPEAKTGKNRLHPDLTATDLPAEVERLVTLGATRLAEHTEEGATWVTLADPEGNEFDVVAG
ncbi:MAG TPA: VOC family protein [Iamia sp.]|nr:VOC family protein [Iamia sp.]